MTRATETAYKELQYAFDYYNQHLFDGELPDCLITFQRGKNTMGYFSSKRFISTNGNGSMIDEIALNPEYFPSYPLIEVMQTIVHEQCHMWQFHFGNPSRKGYHNAEWATKMESCGLMPSDTGQPGGRKLGQSIADYPIPGGKFQRVTLELFRSDFALSWFDRFPVRAGQPKDMTDIVKHWRESLEQANGDIGEIESLLTMALVPSITPGKEFDHENDEVDFQDKPRKRNKMTYSCPKCKVKIWGKPGLFVNCGICDIKFDEFYERNEE